jgi:hypothetical protein
VQARFYSVRFSRVGKSEKREILSKSISTGVTKVMTPFSFLRIEDAIPARFVRIEATIRSAFVLFLAVVCKSG